MKALTNRIPDNQQIDESIENLTQVLNGGIESENFNYQKISGTTTEIANMTRMFQHRLKEKPALCFPVLGCVYIETVTDSEIDVRSIAQNETFTIIIVR